MFDFSHQDLFGAYPARTSNETQSLSSSSGVSFPGSLSLTSSLVKFVLIADYRLQAIGGLKSTQPQPALGKHLVLWIS